MAITKQDCLVLLNELKDKGVDVKDKLRQATLMKDLDLDIVEFINSNRLFDVSKFYEKLRKSYNSKKSLLYKLIVKSDEVDDPKDVAITLSSLGLLILLFSKTVSDLQMFLRQARYDELTACLYHYGRTFDLLPCVKLLRLFKTDLKAFEYFKSKKDIDD